MQLMLIAMLVLVGVVGLAACANEELAAPAPPMAGMLPQIMGDLPTSHLIEANGFRYLPSAGVEITVAVNQGLFTAAQKGEADFQITARLVVRSAGGQTRAISPKTDPLVLLKTFLTDGQFSYAKLLVPWDGLDDNGNPMTGVVTTGYVIELVQLEADGGVVIGAVQGSTEFEVDPIEIEVAGPVAGT